MTYNLTFMETSTNLLQVTIAVNNASGNLFGTLFVYIFWIGSLLVMSKGSDPLVSLIGSSFFTSVVAIMFLILGIVTWPVAIMPVSATLISTILLMMSK